MKQRLFLFLPFVLLNACNKEGGPPGHGGPPPAQPVTVAAVEQRELVEWGEFSGRIEAKESVELRPRVSGYLESVSFQAGELVNANDTLFLIDPRVYKAAADKAGGELKRAEAAAKAAAKEFGRAASLLSVKAISPEQADERESADLQARAAVAAAEAGVRAAALDVEFATVKAPISGRISRALVTEGNYVTAGQTVLTTIVSVDPVYVYVDMDENTLLRVQALQRGKKLALDEKGRVPAEIQLSGETGYAHKGWIESFDNKVDEGTGSISVRVELPNTGGTFIPGLFARVRLPLTAKYSALLVQESAIRTDQSRKYVTLVSAQNTAEYCNVTPGPMYEGKRIIRSGLKGGEKVVVNGQARIFMPGQPLAPEEEKASASPAAPPSPAAPAGPAPKTAAN